MLLQPDHLEDLAYVIMHEMARMIYRVDSDDVGRACNQVQISAGVLSCQSEDLQFTISGFSMYLCTGMCRIARDVAVGHKCQAVQVLGL